ncbi:MAG: alpha/beta hydrolase fold domain-containing protein [Blastocatellales bacterium]
MNSIRIGFIAGGIVACVAAQENRRKEIMKQYRLSACLFLTLCLFGVASAQDLKWEAVKYRAVEDVVYGQKDGMGLTMDVLIPETKPKKIGVIFIVSGSWKSRKNAVLEDEEKQRKQHWAQGLLNGGYTLFLVRHGSAPRYFIPEMISDVRRGIRFVRSRAKDYGVDPNRIGISGASSGAHLALMAALTADDGKPDAKDPVERVSSRVQAIVAWFPPTDLINFGGNGGYKRAGALRPTLFQEMFGKVTDLEAQLKSISPINFVNQDAPPLLLIHGDADKTVPIQQSQALKSKYEEMKRPVKLIVQPGGPHTYWLGIEKNYPEIWGWFGK